MRAARPRIRSRLTFVAVALAAGVATTARPAPAQHVPSASELDPRERGSEATTPLDRAEAYASGWTARSAARPDVSGTLRVLVVLTLFADSPEPTFSPEAVQAAMFDGPNPQGTVSDLYAEQSRGAFQVTGTVTPWIRSSFTLAEVRGGDLNNGEPPQRGPYLLEAIAAADADLDLGQFDNDGPDGVPNSGDDNGIIDSVFFLYGEVGAHCGGDGPWPHFSGLSPLNDQMPYESDDSRPNGQPVQVDPYVLSTVVDCAGLAIGAAPVAAHELGHVIGLADHYHPSPGPGGSLAVNRRWVLGCWDLMAAGAWGCGSADEVSGNFGPTGLSAYNKDRLGWLTLEAADDVVQREYVLEPVLTGGRVLQVPLDDVGKESYLVEYRPQVGFDRLLPASGVLIYHWDVDGSLRPDPSEPYRVDVVEADANGSLQRTHLEGGNRGEAGDAWAIDGGDARFTALTTPATLRNGGGAAPVTFHSIRVEDGVARIRVSTRETATVVGGEDLPVYQAREAVDVRLPVGGGVLPYALSEPPTMPVGMSADLDGEELVLSGAPLGTGEFVSQVGIRDGIGRLGTSALRFVVAALAVATERLLAPFLETGEPPLTPDQIEILDNDGNGNGRYDVGDLRAQLLRSP